MGNTIEFYAAARGLDPAATEDVLQALIGHGYTDVDFAALLELEARAAGLELVSEDAPVTDGLRDDEPMAAAR